MFDPKTTRYPYPEDTGSHYLVVKKDDGTVFDANYPYVDRSKKMKRTQFWMRVGICTIVYPLLSILLGLKIRGRENLKKHAEAISNGVISVSNHVHLWDYLSIIKAIRPHRPNVLSWAPDIRGENGKLIRATGGIPIPEDDVRATIAYIRAVGKLLEEGGWLQIYAEGSMWEFYAPIRPFKHGLAYFAIKYKKPIIPMGFSFRKPGWIHKHVFRQDASLTLTIGEPLFANPELTGKEAEEELTRRAHEAVCRLAGIEPSENLYAPIYSPETGKRIDYYADHYGPDPKKK